MSYFSPLFRLFVLTLIALTVVGFCVTRAHADTVNVTWTAPTAREDGTLLPATEIAGYRLSWTLNGVAQSDVSVAGVSHTLDTASGRVCVVVRTVDTDGLESIPTDEACRKARPNRPSNLRVR